MSSGEDTAPPLIVVDRDFGTAPADLIGGKAAGLGALIEAGASVPPGFCLSTAAFGMRLERPATVDNELRAAIARLRARGVTSFAVRSSHAWEDRAGSGSPGVYRSEIGLSDEDEIVAAVDRVAASATADAAVDYRRWRGIRTAEPLMAVLVQAAPQAATGGVIYTMLPHSEDASSLLIEYAAGSPSNVIDNLTPPHRCVVDKRERDRARPEVDLLTPDQLQRLISWALTVERRLDAPLDVEWLIDPTGMLWLLQARRLAYPAVQPDGPYTAPAAGTALRSDKLAPFRLAGGPVRTVDAHLILPSAFAAFHAAGGTTPPGVLTECRAVFQHYLDLGPVSLRSVYWSGLGTGDMLPQSPMLRTIDDCVAHVESYWRYIVSNGRRDYSAQIAMLAANWIRPSASIIATAPGTADDPVVLSALHGYLEGLETCSHDIYRVDPASLRMLAVRAPHKPLAVLAAGGAPEPLPPELANRPVLSDAEIRAAAGAATAVAKQTGPARVELLVSDREVVTWQITPLSRKVCLQYYEVRTQVGPMSNVVASGAFRPLHHPDEVPGRPAGPESVVVAIDFERFRLRDPQLAASLAIRLRDLGQPLVLKGSVLSHLGAARLR